jgi:hypothetical protein
MINLGGLVMGAIVSRLLAVAKKPIVGWVGAMLIGLAAALLGMQKQEVKDLVCSRDIPDISIPAVLGK